MKCTTFLLFNCEGRCEQKISLIHEFLGFFWKGSLSEGWFTNVLWLSGVEFDLQEELEGFQTFLPLENLVVKLFNEFYLLRNKENLRISYAAERTLLLCCIFSGGVAAPPHGKFSA
ncbi:uncharacterized protein LOC131243816 [Magnolia sinica]|uniref:uncharacterized protein LOC131243816 n=1 Tax=Magnolia sinica TaxID=86752 RepID=UPI002658585A|nr:uncharacterized protein LOC131243816 [Magnolia sinica]